MLYFVSMQVSFGKVRSIQNGIQFEIGNLNQKVQFYSSDVVRVVKWLSGTTPDSTSLIVTQKALPTLAIKVKENGKKITLVSEKLQVIIDKTDGHIEYLDRKNVSILKENGQSDILPDNLKNEKAFNIKQSFQLTDDEGIYGLGQHQDGYLNYRGRTVKLVQTNTNAVSPFFISTRNYGILWDNYSYPSLCKHLCWVQKSTRQKQ